MKKDANVSVHLGVGGCLISVKLLKYIPRIKEQRRIWFVRLHSLSLYFGKSSFENKENSWINWIWTEEERRVRELDYLISAHAEE